MLQCLLATESLSSYFRNLHWKREVNQDNPLGMGGKVAEAYAGLNDDVRCRYNRFDTRCVILSA